ncbi:MAG: DUF4926 domain-containing protein [Pirellulales bacterium]|nr:DUF4926 domain-containing protein [Pirellulales bacterium]
MNLELFGRAILNRDVPDAGLRYGDVDTIVEVYRDSSDRPIGYELELFSATDETLAVVSVPADALREPTAADRLASRVA